MTAVPNVSFLMFHRDLLFCFYTSCYNTLFIYAVFYQRIVPFRFEDVSEI